MDIIRAIQTVAQNNSEVNFSSFRIKRLNAIGRSYERKECNLEETMKAIRSELGWHLKDRDYREIEHLIK